MHMVLKKEQYLNKQIIGLLIVLLVTMFSLGGCSQSYDEHVQMVRNGTMNMRPNVPVGEAFDQFFKDGEWKYFEATDNSKVVEFSGKCSWEGKTATATIQFIITGDKSFQLGHTDINGVSLNKLESTAMVEKVLESYHKKK